MQHTLVTFLCLCISFQLTAQTLSSPNPVYMEKVTAGEAALKAEAYTDCLKFYQEAFTIKQKSYLSTMRGAACAFKANDEVVLEEFLNMAFKLNWEGSKQTFDHYTEFKFLKGTGFEKMVNDRYQTAAIANGINFDLIEELSTIRKTDQQYRMTMGSISEKYGWDSPQMDSVWVLQNFIDSVNTQRVEEIIAEHGYPGKSMVGDGQASTAFLVIQHAALEIQEKYLPIITKAADKDEVRWSSVALLVDRVRMRKGQPQIYGSQLNTDQETGKHYFALIKNPHEIDSMRATVNLGPIQQYADHWNLKWDADAHIQFHKELAKRMEAEEKK